MMLSSDLEIINLDVQILDGKVIKAKSSGNRLRGFEKAFIGKNANNFFEILPRILATCSQSHIYSYTKPFSDKNESIRRLLIMLEIIESHIKHPYVYWFPNLTRDTIYDFPSGEKFRKVAYYAKKIKEIMDKIGGKWPHVEYLRSNRRVSFDKNQLNEVRRFFENEIIGMPIEDFLSVSSIEEIEESKGDAAKLVSWGKEALFWNSGLKRYLVVGFPFESNADVASVEDHGLSITYKGLPVEVGPLAQALTFDNLIRKYHDRYGPSPLLRELSRLKIISKLISMIEDIDIESEKFNSFDGNFESYVESIRGSLIHYFSIKNNIIESYRIVQPTTIISTPNGALENIVLGLQISDIKDPKELALAVSSLDTCFITNIRIIKDNNVIYTKRIGGFC